LAEGDDTLTTGGGYISHISTWDGDDTVNMGLGGAATIRLGRGDDLIKLNDLTNAGGTVVWGGDGVDTADFSVPGVAVTISLNLNGAWQNAPGGIVDLSFFENLIGSALNDQLEGDLAGNSLTGGLGNDSLAGLGGADLLIGGRGNDSLTGGSDADTFQFNAGGGRDRIADFVAGLDLIEFTRATSMASITFAKLGTGVLLTVGMTEVVVENTTVAVMNDAANFLF
jgi:Ca2+-binding RTX toxin-like protein